MPPLLKKPGLLVAGLLLLAVVATVLFMRSRGATVPVYTVKPQDLVQSLAVSGRVVSEARVALGATLTGRVAEVRKRAGDTLAAGELLVLLEDTELAATERQAQAALQSAQARLDSQRRLAGPLATQQLVQARANAEAAQRELVRNQELLAQGFIGQARVDEIKRAADVARSAVTAAETQREAQVSGTELLQAQTRVAEAQAALALARARLAQTRITSPGAAVVLSRLVEPGQIVQPGTRLAELSVQSPLQLVALVDEKFITRLSLGQAALATADAFARQPFEARIASIAPLVDAQRGSVEVKFSLKEGPTGDGAKPLPALKNDMSVSIEVVTGRQPQALAVPGEAIRNGPAVLVLVDGRAVLRPVKTGLRTLAWVQITEGLRADDQVVLANSVAPGDRVRGVPSSHSAALQPADLGGAMNFGNN